EEVLRRDRQSSEFCERHRVNNAMKCGAQTLDVSTTGLPTPGRRGPRARWGGTRSVIDQLRDGDTVLVGPSSHVFEYTLLQVGPPRTQEVVRLDLSPKLTARSVLTQRIRN